MLEQVISYIGTINIEKLSMEDLEHYTKILIMIENAQSLEIEKKEILKKLEESRNELKQS